MAKIPLAATGTVNKVELPRGEHTYRKLKDAIQTGALKPGDRLREAKLASLVGNSRTPVRAALCRLESEGIVIRDPSRGMIVVELDVSLISELYAVREALEGTAAALAARHASEGEVLTLRQIADRDSTFAHTPERLANNNRQFHDTLYRSAHNRYLLETLKALYESMALVRTTLAYNKQRIKLIIEQHQGIVTAIERQDSKLAEELVRAHVRAAGQARLALLLGSQEGIAGPNYRS